MGNFKQENIQDVLYIPSQDEKEKLGYIRTRFSDMETARFLVDKDWWKYQDMVDAKYRPSPRDTQPTDVVPISNAMIESYVSDAIKLKTQFNFKGETDKYKNNAKAFEYAWKHDWRVNKRDKIILDNEYITATFGTSVLYTGFEKCLYEQETYNIKTGKFEKEKIEDNKIIINNVDIRNFYPDDTIITDFSEANDCIYIQYINIETFKGFEYNSFYKNIDKITKGGFTRDLTKFNVTYSENNDSTYVKITHYYNLEKDRYIVVANDSVVIRDHPILQTINGRKALPFVMRKFANKNYSVWGTGICERAIVYNVEINTIRQLLLRAIEKSNVEILAIGNGLTFNKDGFSYDNSILEFDGPLAGNLQQLNGTPPNQAIFNHLEFLIRDGGMGVGIDMQNTYGDKQLTAFQSDMMREASQKRVNLWLRNRDFAFERLADLYKELLQTRYTTIYQGKEIRIDGGMFTKSGEFRKTNGVSEYEIKDKDLEGNTMIDVYTNATAPTINAVDREQKVQFLTTVGNITQSYAVAKQSGFDLEQTLPIGEVIEDLANSYNLVPRSRGKGKAKEEFDKLKGQLQKMLEDRQQANKPGVAQMEGMPTQEQPQQPQAPAPNLPPM